MFFFLPGLPGERAAHRLRPTSALTNWKKYAALQEHETFARWHINRRKGDLPVKKTMFRLMLTAAAMLLAVTLGVAGYAEEADGAVSTTAYLFWQDSDWWPAVTNQEDDYWAPVTATVTGEGWYPVSATAHMPSWFNSGGNHNTGAQKLAVVITDGATLFPDLYMQIVDIRVDGVSYACGDVTYGQTGYDNIGQDGFVSTWDGKDGTISAINPDDLKAVNNLEVDFFVTGEQGKLPEEPVLSYDYTWYPNNTMGVAGYSLRDMGVSNKWYNACPVDLTRDGIYQIPLVVSNMYVIGNAIVTVEGDTVTVDYETQHASPGNLTILSECVQWFDELEDITAEFMENPQSDLAFGQTISKTDLGKVGYLFICNRVTYCQPIADNGIYLARYNHNSVTWAAYRAGLDAMVEALEETPAE